MHTKKNIIPILLILLNVKNHWIIPELFSIFVFSQLFFISFFIKISLSVKNYFFNFFVNFNFFSIFLQNSLSKKRKNSIFYEWFVKCTFWPYWTAPNTTSTSDLIIIVIIVAITHHLIKISLFDFNLYNLSPRLRSNNKEDAVNLILLWEGEIICIWNIWMPCSTSILINHL